MVIAALASAFVQSECVAEEPPPVAELERLVATLEDDAERAKLVADLRALIAVQRGEATVSRGAAVLDRLSARMGVIGAGLRDIATSAGDWRDIRSWFANEVGEPARRETWIRAAASVAVVIAIAMVVGRAVGFALRRTRRGIEARVPTNLGIRFLLLSVRSILDLMPTVAFAVAGYATITLVEPVSEARVIALALINASLATQMVAVLGRLVFAPLAPNLRLVPIVDETAAYLDVWLRRIAGVAIYGYLGSQAVLLLGLPEVGYGLLVRLVGFVVTVLAIVFVLQNRAGVASSLRGDDTVRASRPAVLQVSVNRLADVWHLLVVGVLVLMFGGWAFDVESTLGYLLRGVFATVIIIVLARLAIGLIDRAMRRLMDVGSEIAQRLPVVEARANRYLPLVRRALGVVVAVIAALLVLEAWDAGGFDWFATAWGRDLLGRLVAIVAIVLIATVVWEIGNGIILRYLEGGDDGQAVRSARMRTLLPLVRSTLLLVIVALAAFTTLAELGVNIGPLLAGAGVVGLAVGFGAQTLVKDVISGALILFEDQIAVDDSVEINGKAGTVEGMTIRTLSLRDGQGFIHTIPFGAVAMVTNMSRDFGYHVLDLNVAYGEDVNRVTAALREVDAELRKDPAFARSVTGSIEILGVESIDRGGVVIRAQVRTRPGHQGATGRAYRQAIKQRFDRDGIAFARARPIFAR